MGCLRSLKKAILKVPRWIYGKIRPKKRRDERTTHGDDNCDVVATADDRCDKVDHALDVAPAEDVRCEDFNDAPAAAPTEDDRCEEVNDALAAAPAEVDLCDKVDDALAAAPAEDDRADHRAGDNPGNAVVTPVAAVADPSPTPVIIHRALAMRGYTVNKTIGEGGYGSILLARSKRHHGQMAIKVIEKLSNGQVDRSLQWSIDNEKRFADLFDHPFLNVYHEIIDTSRRTYMVMDYYHDGTLWDYCREVDYTPEPVAYTWFSQLCSALKYVHARGFAHRDVKLENVLLDQRRRIRLADFGSCGPASADMLNYTMCGTTSYMAPELLARGPYHGQLADVWAAGVLLYCLVVGRFPFPIGRHGTLPEDIARVLEGQRNGYGFCRREKQRLSVECQSFFGHIFVIEADRKEMKDLKRCQWMIKEAQNKKR